MSSIDDEIIFAFSQFARCSSREVSGDPEPGGDVLRVLHLQEGPELLPLHSDELLAWVSRNDFKVSRIQTRYEDSEQFVFVELRTIS